MSIKWTVLNPWRSAAAPSLSCPFSQLFPSRLMTTDLPPARRVKASDRSWRTPSRRDRNRLLHLSRTRKMWPALAEWGSGVRSLTTNCWERVNASLLFVSGGRRWRLGSGWQRRDRRGDGSERGAWGVTGGPRKLSSWRGRRPAGLKKHLWSFSNGTLKLHRESWRLSLTSNSWHFDLFFDDV